jgi:hypothetical protein
MEPGRVAGQAYRGPSGGTSGFVDTPSGPQIAPSSVNGWERSLAAVVAFYDGGAAIVGGLSGRPTPPEATV